MIVYRPPYSSAHPNTVSMFLEEFSDTLSHILSNYANRKILLMGDFNVHVDDPNNSDARAFADMLCTFDLQQLVNISTHTSGHTLDLCIVPCITDLFISNISDDYFISDHTFVSLNLNISKPQREKVKVQYRKTKNIDKLSFARDLEDAALTLSDMHGNELIHAYNSMLLSIYNKHAPLVTKYLLPRTKVSWYDQTAKQLKIKGRQLERRWKRTQDPVDLLNYKHHRGIYRKYLSDMKSTKFKDAVSEAKGDPRRLYSVAMGLMGKTTDNPLPPGDPSTLADEFADYFLQKVEYLRDSLRNVPRYNPQPILTTLMCEFSALSVDEVMKIIKESKPSTCATDPIPTTLIKEHIDIMAPVITKIINESLLSGEFPNSWKLATVKPQLKKPGLHLVPSNYRPISTMPFASKVLEKGVIKQLNHHLTDSGLHSRHQSAYKQNFGTETALCYLVNSLLWCMEKGEVTILAAVDLSAAFDMVDHDILMSILETRFGFHDTCHRWLSSYLRDRCLQVLVDQYTSSSRTFNYSVPQGSCLGPVLFNIYTSTIVDCIMPNQDLGSYADDHYLMESYNPSTSGAEAKCREKC